MNYIRKKLKADIAEATASTNKKIARRRGVTLVEVMMVLGVMAFILGLVMLVAALVNASNRSNQFIEEITTLVDVSNQLTAGSSDLTSLNAGIIAQSGLMPRRWVSGTTNLVSPFGATVNVVGTAAGAGTNGLTTFTITANSVPQTACVKISTMDFGNALVNRTPAPSSSGGGTNANGAPLSASDAANNCTSNNIMTFEFSRG